MSRGVYYTWTMYNITSDIVVEIAATHEFGNTTTLNFLPQHKIPLLDDNAKRKLAHLELDGIVRFEKVWHQSPAINWKEEGF